MDLERIKQNLRLRSGRSRKPRKASKAPKNSEPVEKPAKVEETPSKAVEEKLQPIENDTDDLVNGHVNGQVNGNGTNSEEQEEEHQVEEQEVVEDKNSADSRTKEETQDEDRADPAASGAAQTESKTDGEDPIDETIEEEMAPEKDNAPSTKDQDEEKIQDTKIDEEGPYSRENNTSSDSLDFDLNPPSFKPKPPSVEQMSELLFSAGHFTTLLHHPALLAHFSTFLHRYRPKDYPILIRYIEASKAIAAIEYASAIAEAVPRLPDETEQPQAAVSVAESFQNLCSGAFDTLVNTTLPMYITYNLVKVVSQCLTSEITGRASPMMKELVAGLSEIFCLTDPNREDNPIIYASEEFYRLTGYGRDDVIGHNCRFLQGPKTKREGPARLRECLDKGEETCETLLNYRRDGRPFINLLMIAPLHDDKGNVKYNIGAQVDVSGLIAGGRTLDGFQRYLQQRKRDEQLEHEREQSEQNVGRSSFERLEQDLPPLPDNAKTTEEGGKKSGM
jgi:PAS domain S-box-containing protein